MRDYHRGVGVFVRLESGSREVLDDLRDQHGTYSAAIRALLDQHGQSPEYRRRKLDRSTRRAAARA